MINCFILHLAKFKWRDNFVFCYHSDDGSLLKCHSLLLMEVQEEGFSEVGSGERGLAILTDLASSEWTTSSVGGCDMAL